MLEHKIKYVNRTIFTDMECYINENAWKRTCTCNMEMLIPQLTRKCLCTCTNQHYYTCTHHYNNYCSHSRQTADVVFTNTKRGMEVDTEMPSEDIVKQLVDIVKNSSSRITVTIPDDFLMSHEEYSAEVGVSCREGVSCCEGVVCLYCSSKCFAAFKACGYFK